MEVHIRTVPTKADTDSKIKPLLSEKDRERELLKKEEAAEVLQKTSNCALHYAMGISLFFRFNFTFCSAMIYIRDAIA